MRQSQLGSILVIVGLASSIGQGESSTLADGMAMLHINKVVSL
jgi:hypothetical protein